MKISGFRHQTLGTSSTQERRGFFAGTCRLEPVAYRGFTLIEMIVSIAIFMFVMLIAVGSLVALVGADRKAQSIEAVVDNLRFALDDMSRYVRTGTEYDASVGCSSAVAGSNDCPSGSSQIAVIPQIPTYDGGGNPYKQVYRFSSALQCGVGFPGGCLMRSTDSGASYLPITSPEINIDYTHSQFFVRGSSVGDGRQPEVVMTLTATMSANAGTSTILHLQSTVTQRAYDN